MCSHPMSLSLENAALTLVKLKIHKDTRYHIRENCSCRETDRAEPAGAQDGEFKAESEKQSQEMAEATGLGERSL